MCTGYMIEDEFPADIAAGSAFSAGHNEVGRPVLVIYSNVECPHCYFLDRSLSK